MSYTDGAQQPNDWGSVGGTPVAPAAGDKPANDWTAVGGKPVGDEDYLKAYGSGVSKGVSGVVEAPGGYGSDVGGWLGSKARPYVEPYTGPAARAVRGVFDAAGNWISGKASEAVKDTPLDPAYEPKTAGGRMLQTAGEMTPYAIAGPMTPEALAIRAGTQVAAPAVTGEAGYHLGPYVGLTPEQGQAVGTMVAPIAAGGIAALRPGEALADANATLGTSEMPGVVGSESKIARGAGKLVSKVPVVNMPLRSAARGAQAETEAAAGKVAADAGATTPDATGAAIEKAFNDENQGISDAAKTKYDAVTQSLPAGSDTVTGPLSNTQAAADAISARRTASAAGAGPAYNEVEEALTRPGGLTYQGMRDLRTRLRQEGNKTGLTPGEQAEYGSLQDALTKDINAHLNTLDPTQASSTALKEADKTYASDQGRIQAVGRRLGIDNASVGNEQYVNKVESLALGSSQNADLLKQVRQTLGPSVSDQTAAQIAKKWWTDANGNFAPTAFFKKYNSLTPDAKDALFGAKGSGSGFRDAYDALAIRAQQDPKLQSILGAGGGAGHGGIFSGMVGGMIGAGAEGAISHYLGPAMALKAGAALPAGLTLSTLMARPEVARAAAALARSTQGYPRFVGTAASGQAPDQEQQ